MFGKSKPPTEEMIALRATEDNIGALKLALRYMGKTNKEFRKHDPDFLFQTALLYFELDENELKIVDPDGNQTENIIDVEIGSKVPNWKNGKRSDFNYKLHHDRTLACGLIANGLMYNTKNWMNGANAMLMIVGILMQGNNFDEAEKKIAELRSKCLQIGAKVIKASAEDVTKEKAVLEKSNMLQVIRNWNNQSVLLDEDVTNEELEQLTHRSLTYKGLIAYARDYDPEGAIRFFDTVLGKNPKFESALLFKNDIITMQKGGTGKVLTSITDMKKLAIPGTIKAVWKKTADFTVF